MTKVIDWHDFVNRQPIVTGTSVLGVKYKGGVMLAADMLGGWALNQSDVFKITSLVERE